MTNQHVDFHHLITLVQERPALWNKTSEDYKNRYMKATAWKEVCENLFPGYNGLSNREKTKYGHDVVKKWSGIKDNYIRYVKKLKEMRESGEDGKKVKQYHLYKKLLFLNKNNQSGTHGSIITEGRADQNINKETPQRGASLIHTQPLRKKIFVNASEELENRHFFFFKSILPSLNKLDDHQTLIFQSRVLQILTDLRDPSQQFYYPQSNYRSSFEGDYQSQSSQSDYQSIIGYQIPGPSSQSTQEIKYFEIAGTSSQSTQETKPSTSPTDMLKHDPPHDGSESNDQNRSSPESIESILND